jgi:hypothetical protein
MRDEDTINASERLREDLLTEVRTTVDEQSRLRCLDKYRAAQSAVVRVGAAARRTLTANDRHPTGSTSAQERDFHLSLHI